MAGQASLVLLRPFREVMKWASLAAVYAQDASNDPQQGYQLQRASSALLKDAERAVKRITSYIESPSPQLNAFLTDLVLRNTEVIAEYRAIDVLLYDFEDYIEASSFDEAKFTALSAAIKALALLLLERIQRFTAESTLDSPPPPPPPPSSMGPLRPLPALPAARANISERMSQPTDLPVRLSSKFTPTPTVTEVKPEPITASSPDGNFVGLGRIELGSPISISSMVRPASAASARSNQPPKQSQSVPRRDNPYRPRLASVSQRDQIHEQIHEEEPADFDGYSSPPDRSVCASPETAMSKPEAYRPSHVRRTSSSVSRWPQASDYDVDGSTMHQSYVSSSQSPTNRQSTFDQETSVSSGTSHSSHRGSVASSAGAKPGCNIGQESSLYLLGGFCKGARSFAASGPGQAIKKVGGTGNQASQGGKQDFSQEMLFGAMLAVDTTTFSEPMAQCVNCEYQTIYSQLLQDMDSDPLAKRQSCGITYRSRFLYKSHITVKDTERIFFACVFCDKLKSTCHKGDATVFQSVDHLFRHLARHPLPLPPVAGVTVLYDEPKGGPPANLQNYDLILPDAPPLHPPGPPADVADYIASLPTARALKDHIRRRNGRPQDRPDNVSEVLQFLANACILGVEYPDKWDGKWCQGWHDGVLGVFPSKIIQLEAPENVHSIIKSVPRSLRTGVAKWEWDPKARMGTSHWLTFSKGSKISGLAWDDPHAWYWVGTNSKGKIGIFPKSHIRLETIQDGSLSEPQGGGKSSSRWGLFGKRS